jgi:hypothetical protein
MALYKQTKPSKVQRGLSITRHNSSEQDEIPPNSLSFKNVTNTNEARKINIRNNRVSDPSLQERLHSLQIKRKGITKNPNFTKNNPTKPQNM